MLGQEVQRPGRLFQLVELCPLLVPCGLLGLDTVFQINPQRNFAGFFGLPLRKPPFDALGDGFLGIGFSQRFAAGEAFLSGRTERNKMCIRDRTCSSRNGLLSASVPGAVKTSMRARKTSTAEIVAVSS